MSLPKLNISLLNNKHFPDVHDPDYDTKALLNDALQGLLNNDVYLENIAVGGGTGGITWSVPPATSSSIGRVGDIAFDSQYFYICIETDKWGRFPIHTNW